MTEIKTEIRYPYIYEHILNKREKMWTLKEYKLFKSKIKKFKRLHDKYIEKILKLIEKYTKNRKWQYNFIPIYLVSDKDYKLGEYKGFSDPLTLRFFEKENPNILLKTLIHELVHVNLSEKIQLSRSYEKNEEIVKEITNRVYQGLKLK